MKEVTLTADEAEALEDFLFGALIPFIQDQGNEVDNIRWLNLLTNVWQKCNDAGEKK